MTRLRGVPYFNDAGEVYEHIGGLLQSLADDRELAAQFRHANTIVRYEYRDPEEIRVDLGPSELEPEVIMSMEADTAHRFWLGKINVTVALARGQIKARGPVAKILKLAPLVKPAFPRYREMLRAAGRADLSML